MNTRPPAVKMNMKADMAKTKLRRCGLSLATSVAATPGTISITQDCAIYPSEVSPTAGSETLVASLATVAFVPDRSTPKRLTGEKETLLDFLDYLRESVILKMDGLEEEAVRRSSVPTGTSLLGLIKHLTTVEALWFQFAFAGQENTVPGDEIDPSDTTTSAIASYRTAIRTSNDIVDHCNDLDQLCAKALTTAEPLSLRWVLVHMVEETARHAGHADILREQIDGKTGR
jgi:hypothetical protein